MIKTRIASAAAVFTVGMAALGGTVVAAAAPANATPGAASVHQTPPRSHAVKCKMKKNM
jgi:invasion protein IalB